MYDALEALAERASITRLGSLEWPMRLLLGGLPGAGDPARCTGHRARYRELLADVERASDPFARMVLDRSPWVRDMSTF